jgi:ComF family protein
VFPPPFRAVIAPWRYGGELATALRRMKYGRGERSACRSIAALVVDTLRDVVATETIDAIVPVPLAAARLRARGFSQAHELVRALAWRRGPPVEPGGLVRVRETSEQAGLTRSERIRNVTGAFVVPPRVAPRLRDRHVLLVDDVVTTGATATACTRALQRAGAASVLVFAVARAEG